MPDISFRIKLVDQEIEQMSCEQAKNEEFIRLFRKRNRELKEQIQIRKKEIKKLTN